MIAMKAYCLAKLIVGAACISLQVCERCQIRLGGDFLGQVQGFGRHRLDRLQDAAGDPVGVTE